MDGDRPQRVLTELRAFLSADPVPPPGDPQKQVVELFHRVAASVPAYRKWQCCVAGRRSRRLNQSRGEGSPSVTELVRVGDDVDVVVIVVDEVRAEIYLGLSASFIFDLGQ